MIQPPPLPTATPVLIDAYRELIRDCAEKVPGESVVALAPKQNAMTSVPLERSVVALLGLLVRTLDPESASALLEATRAHYALPKLTWPQFRTLLDLAAHVDEITTAEHAQLPLEIFPDGLCWTLLSGFPTHWAHEEWRIHDSEAHSHPATTLAQASALAAQLRSASH